MSEGMTCYERDEALCEDQMCLRTGCRLRNERLSPMTPPTEAMLELADKLQTLCCAETEGKFFDCVTDNIETILDALRSSQNGERERVIEEVLKKVRVLYRDELAKLGRMQEESKSPQNWQGGRVNGIGDVREMIEEIGRALKSGEKGS